MNFSVQDIHTVYLSLTDQLLGGCNNEFANGFHAQIVWCKPLNTGSDPRFGVGVKYFEPFESQFKRL